MEKLDTNMLSKIGQDNPTAKAITEVLADRRRMRHFTDMNRLKTNLSKVQTIDDDKFMEYFKSLETAGVGSVIIGRRGNPDRFHWGYSLKDVAQAMTGKIDKATALPPTPKNYDKRPNRKPWKAEMKGRKRKPGRPRKLETVAKRGRPTKLQSVFVLKTQTVVIPLRKDFTLQLQVPADVNRAEVSTIQDALGKVLI